MRTPHIDDRVRLVDNVPETPLTRGQVGVVCSTWPAADEPTFEVEFSDGVPDGVMRRLLTIRQIEIDMETERGVVQPTH